LMNEDGDGGERYALGYGLGGGAVIGEAELGVAGRHRLDRVRGTLAWIDRDVETGLLVPAFLQGEVERRMVAVHQKVQMHRHICLGQRGDAQQQRGAGGGTYRRRSNARIHLVLPSWV